MRPTCKIPAQLLNLAKSCCLPKLTTYIQPKATINISRRNFKSIAPTAFETALCTWDWASVHRLSDVVEIVGYINAGVVSALDIVAPVRSIRKERQ
jgi:hypothetical protein